MRGGTPRAAGTTNYTKSADSMLKLLWALDCEVEIVVKDRPVGARPKEKKTPSARTPVGS